MRNDKFSRRDFIRLAGAISVSTLTASTFLTFLAGCSKYESPTSPPPPPQGKTFTINLSQHPELNQVGGYKTFQVDSTPIIVFRTSQTTFKALSLVCTHQGCTINWQNSAQQFQCPCHGSKFDKDGNVIQGPATRALTTYRTEYNSQTNQVIVYL